MQFTLKQLRYFEAAFRCESIAKAASEMNISQSSITAAIDVIEESLGFELFRRMPAKGIRPTRNGRAVGARVAEYLEQTRIFQSDLLSLAGDPIGTLRMGCYAPTAPYMLPRLLNRVASEYPSIRVDLKEGDLEAMVGFLQSGLVDIALTYRRVNPTGLPFMPLFRARPYALLPETSPLAARTNVSIADLADLPMIMLDLPATRTYFSEIFEEQGYRPKVIHSTKSSSVLRGLVAANFGYSMLNICGPNDRAGKSGYVSRPITGDLDAPYFGMAYTKASKRSTIVRAVLEISSDLASAGAFDDLVMLPEDPIH